jgi:hypothetical protein
MSSTNDQKPTPVATLRSQQRQSQREAIEPLSQRAIIKGFKRVGDGSEEAYCRSMQISRIFIQLTTRFDNIDRTLATPFRIPLLFMRFVITRDKLTEPILIAWIKQYTFGTSGNFFILQTILHMRGCARYAGTE